MRFALCKDFPTWRQQKLQFRVEALNAFNHTNFSTINTNYGAAPFGNVTAATDARFWRASCGMSSNGEALVLQ